MPKYHAHGTVVEFASATVGGLTSITLPDRQKGEVEITDGESGFDREFLPGLRDGGTVQLEGRHDPDDAGQEALEDNWESDQDVETLFITLPSRARTSV